MSEDVEEMLRQQQAELERVRARRRGGGINKLAVRRILNAAFLVLSAVGLVLYLQRAHHDLGFMLILCGMFLKVVEFIIRFLG